MKRRDFVAAGLAGLGLAAAGVPSRRDRAQTQGIRPIAIARSNTRHGRFIGRVCPMPGRNFMIMLTTPRGERWYRVPTPSGARGLLQRVRRSGELRIEVSAGGETRETSLNFAEVEVTFFDFRMEGGFAGDATEGEVIIDGEIGEGGENGGGGSTNALGPFGFLLGALASLPVWRLTPSTKAMKSVSRSSTADWQGP